MLARRDHANRNHDNPNRASRNHETHNRASRSHANRNSVSKRLARPDPAVLAADVAAAGAATGVTINAKGENPVDIAANSPGNAAIATKVIETKAIVTKGVATKEGVVRLRSGANLKSHAAKRPGRANLTPSRLMNKSSKSQPSWKCRPLRRSANPPPNLPQ
jgi:hypothetical protein